jgi:hypothetical protein
MTSDKTELGAATRLPNRLSKMASSSSCSIAMQRLRNRRAASTWSRMAAIRRCSGRGGRGISKDFKTLALIRGRLTPAVLDEALAIDDGSSRKCARYPRSRRSPASSGYISVLQIPDEVGRATFPKFGRSFPNNTCRESNANFELLSSPASTVTDSSSVPRWPILSKPT